jgi:hypothetical protein
VPLEKMTIPDGRKYKVNIGLPRICLTKSRGLSLIGRRQPLQVVGLC